MKRVRLFHWNPAEAVSRLRELKDLEYDVVYDPLNPGVLRSLKNDPPAAVLIDLSRAPSQGRDIGIYIRHYKTTRRIPIVFVGGEPEKVAKIRQHLPDAVYTNWNTVRSGLNRAIAHPPTEPVASESLMAGYSGKSLVKKLGIKPQYVVVLIDAPNDFPKVLVDMPDGVVLQARASRKNDLVIWFVTSQRVLNKRIKKIIAVVGKGGLWIVWPKKSSRISSDLTQTAVRKVGLRASLVDYKVCAIDQIWAGLKFAVRKKRSTVTDSVVDREGA